jgi:hypothetical protein
MKRNTAGQKIGAQIITAADGTAFAGSVTVYVTKDAGTQVIGSVGSGAATDEGNGYYTYAPSQAETDGDLLAFTFIGSGAIPVTVQVVPSSEVWDVVQANHTTAGTMGKTLDLLRKANAVVEGTVLASPAPTATTFTVSGLAYPTGAFNKSVLWFASDASIAEQNSPIATFVNNGDGTQTITLQDPLTTAPTAGDGILIDPTSHVHTIAEIQSGLATAANQVVLIDGMGFVTSVLMGSISDAGTAAETYQISFGGSTYTVDYSGLDATGNRSTTTRTKT